MQVVARDVFVATLLSRGSEKLQERLLRYDLDMIRGECAIHEGALTPAANWRLPTDNLLVLGAIDSPGLMDIAPDDQGHRGTWGGSLWTLGDVRCRSLANHYGASVVVDGDLVVAELAVTAFEDSTLLVTGDFTAHFFYGHDIWTEVGGRAAMEYGVGYALPLGYVNAAAQVIDPRHGLEESLPLLNLNQYKDVDKLVAKLRRGEHFRLPRPA